MLNGSYFLERFFSAKRIEYVYHMTLENILIKVRKIYVKIHKFHAQWFLVILLHVHVHVSYFFYLRARIRYYANFLFATFCWYTYVLLYHLANIYTNTFIRFFTPTRFGLLLLLLLSPLHVLSIKRHIL